MHVEVAVGGRARERFGIIVPLDLVQEIADGRRPIELHFEVHLQHIGIQTAQTLAAS